MIKETIKKYHRAIYFGIFCLLIFAIGLNFLFKLSFPSPTYNFGKRDATRIFPNFPVIQKFIATRDNLNQIKLGLSNVALNGSEKITIELHDESCENPLVQMDLTSLSRRTPIFDKFFFSPITDSQNKTYCLKIKYFTENSAIKKSEYPEVLVDAEMLFSESFKNTRPGSNEKAHSLVMCLSYTNDNSLANLAQLRDRISQDKPFFLKNNYLTVISISFLITTLLLFFFILYQAPNKK